MYPYPTLKIYMYLRIHIILYEFICMCYRNFMSLFVGIRVRPSKSHLFYLFFLSIEKKKVWVISIISRGHIPNRR